MKVYSTDRVPGHSATVLKESPYKIMWTRGNAFYVAPDVVLKTRLDALADYCKSFDKRILLFSKKNGVIRSDIFWTRSPEELFWKQCVDLSEKTEPNVWANVIDTVYRNHLNDPGILVLGKTQSSLYFYT
jgi:hypothetical protein